jgi:hypothetical protein
MLFLKNEIPFYIKTWCYWTFPFYIMQYNGILAVFSCRGLWTQTFWSFWLLLHAVIFGYLRCGHRILCISAFWSCILGSYFVFSGLPGLGRVQWSLQFGAWCQFSNGLLVWNSKCAMDRPLTHLSLLVRGKLLILLYLDTVETVDKNYFKCSIGAEKWSL